MADSDAIAAKYTCSGLIADRCVRRGSAEALVFEDRVWNWQELVQGVDRLARYFAAQGVTSGDRIAIVATNSDFYAMAFLATSRLAAAAVTLNCELSAPEIASLLQRTRPRLILASHDRMDRLDGFDAIPLEGSPDPAQDLWALSADATAPLPPHPDPSATCLIMFTSGTTGQPKGVMQSQRNFVLAGEGFVWRMALTPDERLLCVLPLFHINALFYSFAGALAAGATVILERRFSASRFWRTAAQTRATQVNLIGAAGNILLRRDRSEFEPDHQLSKIYLAPLTQTLHDCFLNEFGVPHLREGYGLTEAPGVINQPIDMQPNIGSMGRVSQHPVGGRPLAELRIQNPDGTDTPNGLAGELLVRSPLLMQGYFEDPEATDAVMQDGWFRTGDLVRRNTDGEYFFIERIKDIIRRRGENISGAELDGIIGGHPHVSQVAVVATPSDLGEDEILAAVVPTRAFSPASFLKWCNATLPVHKRPRYLSFCEDLPRTPSEKIEKYKVRQNPAIRAQAIDLTQLT